LLELWEPLDASIREGRGIYFGFGKVGVFNADWRIESWCLMAYALSALLLTGGTTFYLF